MNNKLVDGEIIALSPAEEQDLVDRATQHAIDQKVYDAQAYARARQPLYPDIGDQLDDLYHKGAFSDEMAAKIKAIKDAHPKPE